MVQIPSHYSQRYINQRYNKALYIVQHLPNTSHVQPTKEQKLELYASYKQVSEGDISTQRPGIFDVVGRAKWDAWKKLEGVGEMEAKYRYVEILLDVATEAYKRPAGRTQAHQIIQSFAVMQPSGDSGDSSSEEEEDDSSISSAEAEEIKYLRQVERSIPQRTNMITNKPSPQQQQKRPLRSSSRASSQYSGHMSMMTAPTELRSHSSQSNTRRRYDFDDSINPWELHPAHHIKPNHNQQQEYRSPMSTSSSVTATQYNQSVTGGFVLGNRSTATGELQQQQQQVMLGPATKRALESIQAEIEALNERINGLRDEIVDRDTNHRSRVTTNRKPTVPEDGWKWVIKAAMKHAAMNMMAATVLFILLYKNNSPIAFTIIEMLQKYWIKVKLGFIPTKAVV